MMPTVTLGSRQSCFCRPSNPLCVDSNIVILTITIMAPLERDVATVWMLFTADWAVVMKPRNGDVIKASRDVWYFERDDMTSACCLSVQSACKTFEDADSEDAPWLLYGQSPVVGMLELESDQVLVTFYNRNGFSC